MSLLIHYYLAFTLLVNKFVEIFFTTNIFQPLDTNRAQTTTLDRTRPLVLHAHHWLTKFHWDSVSRYQLCLLYCADEFLWTPGELIVRWTDDWVWTISSNPVLSVISWKDIIQSISSSSFYTLSYKQTKLLWMCGLFTGRRWPSHSILAKLWG